MNNGKLIKIIINGEKCENQHYLFIKYIILNKVWFGLGWVVIGVVGVGLGLNLCGDLKINKKIK